MLHLAMVSCNLSMICAFFSLDTFSHLPPGTTNACLKNKSLCLLPKDLLLYFSPSGPCCKELAVWPDAVLGRHISLSLSRHPLSQDIQLFSLSSLWPPKWKQPRRMSPACHLGSESHRDGHSLAGGHQPFPEAACIFHRSSLHHWRQSGVQNT